MAKTITIWSCFLQKQAHPIKTYKICQLTTFDNGEGHKYLTEQPWPPWGPDLSLFDQHFLIA